ncbi:MAG: hypothetical protein EXS17_08745 [Phycisphaerales bacterium]|nr:hypothetical protein [Phycisphaerales bacterium]
MSRLPRIFVVSIIALWLPLCCCQVLAFANAACDSEASCCQTSCCDDPSRDEQSSDGGHDEDAPQSCTHCVVKAPAPQPISLDSFFVMSLVAFEAALPHSSIDPTLIHAADNAGGWNVPPPLEPPAPPLHSSERCATLSLWTI